MTNSGATELVINLEFARKQGFKLKKIERPIYVRNMEGFFNKKKPIEHIVEVNIYYQEHRERTEIDVTGEQKQSIILEMMWLAHYNPKIDWKMEEVNMTRYPEECGKQ